MLTPPAISTNINGNYDRNENNNNNNVKNDSMEPTESINSTNSTNSTESMESDVPDNISSFVHILAASEQKFEDVPSFNEKKSNLLGAKGTIF